jgi:hypothetical protein
MYLVQECVKFQFPVYFRVLSWSLAVVAQDEEAAPKKKEAKKPSAPADARPRAGVGGA